ncbi:MAG TPA: NADH-quinone oxidoreductase subunit H, partial [Microthrixaceae bacterium]|nr:NADH-quinone oxidoreductase subunit H [Microthrixaceae bacterium]
LIPVALGWFLVLAGVRVAVDQEWNMIATILGGVAGFILGGTLLMLAIRSSASKRSAAQQVGGLS